MVDWTTLTVMLAIALVAALFSLKLGISVAIIEIILGILAGNILGFHTAGNDWVLFMAALGSVVLTFLAGAEIDPEAMKKTWKANASIGILSFLAPFLASWLFSWLILGWSYQASLLCGVALSTTSVAVVYVVLVETGLSRTETGKMILSACFITDLGTAIALSSLFIRPNAYILVLIAAIVICSLILPRVFSSLFARFKGRSGETDLKLTLLLIAALAMLATVAGSHAVLPAYILGLALAKVYAGNREVILKVRTLALAFLTPFFFINAGLSVSLTAAGAGAGLIAILFLVKVGAKFAGVLPLCKKFIGRNAVYTTLLMSTGLTFGTISAQYGLSAGIIDTGQFSVLVMVVILTAIIPTVIAQRWFRPEEEGGVCN